MLENGRETGELGRNISDYKALNDRQSLVKTVTPLKMNGRKMLISHMLIICRIWSMQNIKQQITYFTHGNELYANQYKGILQTGIMMNLSELKTILVTTMA